MPRGPGRNYGLLETQATSTPYPVDEEGICRILVTRVALQGQPGLQRSWALPHHHDATAPGGPLPRSVAPGVIDFREYIV